MNPTRIHLAIAACAVLAGVVYIGASVLLAGHLGLPVDDAWIHQVFARNAGLYGELSFQLDQFSAGETSPVWAVLLAGSYVLSIPHLVWTFLLGLFALTTVGVCTFYLAWETVLPKGLVGAQERASLALLAAVLVTMEWHLVWASVSGMETVPFTALSLVLVLLFWRGGPGWALGLAGGTLTLLRPEGALLTGLIGLQAFVTGRASLRRLAVFGAVYLLVVTPWLLSNLQAIGTPLPNTYLAKSLATGAPDAAEALLFLVEAGLVMLVGPALMIIPFVWAVWLIASKRWSAEETLLPLAWIAGLVAAYALFLPIPYNHGRYLFPIIPWVILLGVRGLAQLGSGEPAIRRVHIAVNVPLAALLFLYGAFVYGRNVSNVHAQEVAMAIWIRDHTPEDSVIAVEDVGVIGFHSNRRVIDLRGLVSPEIVPVLRRGTGLGDLLIDHGADYLAIFDVNRDMYRDPGLVEVHRTSLVDNITTPGDHLILYRMRGGR